MYGLGLIERRARYRLTGLAEVAHGQPLRGHDLKALAGGDGFLGLADHAPRTGRCVTFD